MPELFKLFVDAPPGIVVCVFALLVLRFALVAVVVGVALKTDDEQRRDAALVTLKILRPALLGKGRSQTSE